MKIAYAGFDLLFPAMQALFDCNNEFIQVFTCKTDNVFEFNKKVISLAKSADISYTDNRITMPMLEKVKEQGCEAFICAGYYYRVPILTGLRMVNIHPAYLPIGRGAWPMPVTILNGLPTSGVTVHKMEESFDTGDILLRQSFDVSKDENLESFMEKIYTLLPPMMQNLSNNFDRLYKEAVKQGTGEYWECPDEKSYVIDKDSDFSYADRVLRAFYGFECAYRDDNKTLGVVRGHAIKGDNKNEQLKIKDGYIIAEEIRELTV